MPKILLVTLFEFEAPSVLGFFSLFLFTSSAPDKENNLSFWKSV